jgi:hypothetical protein
MGPTTLYGWPFLQKGEYRLLDLTIFPGTRAQSTKQKVVELKMRPALRLITTTPACDEELLTKKISELLNTLEHSIALSDEQFQDLESMITILPRNSEFRIESEYRLEKLQELNSVVKLVEQIKSKLLMQEESHEIVSLQKKAQLLLKNCSAGPLKVQLEQYLSSIELSFKDYIAIEETTEEYTTEDIDNMLIELMHPPYIDLETNTRKLVAERLLSTDITQQKTTEEKIRKLDEIIKEVQAEIELARNCEDEQQMGALLEGLLPQKMKHMSNDLKLRIVSKIINVDRSTWVNIEKIGEIVDSLIEDLDTQRSNKPLFIDADSHEIEEIDGIIKIKS